MNREWEWPLVAEALEISGIWTIKEYIQQSQDNVESEVVCRTMYELYKGAERIPGTSKFMLYW